MANINWKSKEQIDQEQAAQPKPLDQQIETLQLELAAAQDTTFMALDVSASLYEASVTKEAQALTALDVAASLYEEILTIKMQLEGGTV